MLTRRHVLFGIGSALVPGALGACSQSRETSPHWPRTAHYEGVEVIELFPNGALESSPLVVAIHGMGDRPDRWIEQWRRFPAKVQIALPRAFDRHGDGWSWFRFEDGMTDEQFGAAVGAAESRLWRGLAKLAAGRRMIVTGFSQGGILSFAIAARHPDAVIRAFPVAGSCPGPLLPREKARAAPILAFHGTSDKVLDVKWGREAVNAFKEQGNEAELKEYEGVGHTISPEMREDLWRAIASAVPKQSESSR
jgi:phospholipase/carboxylesterase